MRRTGILLPLLALAMILAVFTPSLADTRIKFPAGSFGTSVHGAVVRGGTTKYWLGAGKGQHMKVWVTSVEKNAVFRVVGDGGQLSPDEATSWSGRLPMKGDYLIEVSATRGNADFQLFVEIR